MATHRGESFWIQADKELIRSAHTFATKVHEGPWSLSEIARMRGVDVDRAPLAPTMLGLLGTSSGIMWGIVLNDRLNERDAATVMGHELGHTWQTIKLGEAHCEARSPGRNHHEEMANVLGAIQAVPFKDIKNADLFCHAAPLIAERRGVSTYYVHIRNATAVLLGEKAGDDGAARAALDLALLAHEDWVRRVSLKIAVRG